FQVRLPEDGGCPAYKAVFVRQPFRLSDLVELIYLQQGTGVPENRGWRRRRAELPRPAAAPFTQLDGRWEKPARGRLLEPLDRVGAISQFRRLSDGMRCLEIPSAEIEIGSDEAGVLADESPKHVVGLDSFLIDAEPVSTTAYCRFLNSIGDIEPAALSDWF